MFFITFINISLSFSEDKVLNFNIFDIFTWKKVKKLLFLLELLHIRDKIFHHEMNHRDVTIIR